MATGTGNLPYPGKVYNPFDILTAEELNEDVANIESLADGSGIGDGAITPDKRTGGYAIGSFVRTTTGIYSVAGLDFKPRMVTFRYLGSSSTNVVRWCEGVMTEVSQSAASISIAGGNTVMNSSNSACIMRVSGASATPDTLATFVSMNNDGFTIDFTSNSSGGSPEWAWEAYA